MSYMPQDPDALAALALLTESSPELPEGITMLGVPYRMAKREALRELLIALHCPAPCVGYVNDEGWHKTCEAAADTAIEALGMI
jgi:hypothetical protein